MGCLSYCSEMGKKYSCVIREVLAKIVFVLSSKIISFEAN